MPEPEDSTHFPYTLNKNKIKQEEKPTRSIAQDTKGDSIFNSKCYLFYVFIVLISYTTNVEYGGYAGREWEYTSTIFI